MTLQSDPGLDKVDQYGRLLRYVIKSGTNLNIQLVGLGAASVWFYQGDQGRYASQVSPGRGRDRASVEPRLVGVLPGNCVRPNPGG